MFFIPNCSQNVPFCRKLRRKLSILYQAILQLLKQKLKENTSKRLFCLPGLELQKHFFIPKENAQTWEETFCFDHDIGLISSKTHNHGHLKGDEFQLGGPSSTETVPGMGDRVGILATRNNIYCLCTSALDICRHIFLRICYKTLSIPCYILFCTLKQFNTEITFKGQGKSPVILSNPLNIH